MQGGTYHSQAQSVQQSRQSSGQHMLIPHAMQHGCIGGSAAFSNRIFFTLVTSRHLAWLLDRLAIRAGRYVPLTAALGPARRNIDATYDATVGPCLTGSVENRDLALHSHQSLLANRGTADLTQPPPPPFLVPPGSGPLLSTSDQRWRDPRHFWLLCRTHQCRHPAQHRRPPL